MVENKYDLYKLRGSKYLQSRISDIYVKVKEQLENNRFVLFSGTPCQISGLKAFLGKDYEKLYLQDLICHGVPSPKVWEIYLKYIENTNKSCVKYDGVSFRDKSYGWVDSSLLIPFTNSKSHICKFTNDPYMQAFLKEVCLRESCYQCNSKSLQRESDITLADFWGIDRIDREMFDDKGTSLVFVNSKKGAELFDAVSGYMKMRKVNMNEAVKYNPSSKKSVCRPKARNKFIKVINEHNFEQAVKKYTKKSFYVRLKGKIKKIIMCSCTK